MKIISKFDFARGKFDLPDKALEQGGFTAAIWADNTEEISRFKRKRKVFKDSMILIFEGNFISGQ